MHPGTIRRWLAQNRNGILANREAPWPSVGACRKLTMVNEMGLREKIVGQNPQQMNPPFALWPRPAIKALIRKQFGLELQD